MSFLVAHRAGHVVVPGGMHGMEWRRTLSRRATDLACEQLTGVRPLSVAADRIAAVAMRGAGLLSALAAAGRPVDRSGAGTVVETYPAAALRVWGLPYQRYKGRDRTAELDRLVAELTAVAPLDLAMSADLCRQSDDAMGAVLCALVARAAALRMTTRPPPEMQATAALEGWIVLPTEPLPALFHQDRWSHRKPLPRLEEPGDHPVHPPRVLQVQEVPDAAEHLRPAALRMVPPGTRGALGRRHPVLRAVQRQRRHPGVREHPPLLRGVPPQRRRGLQRGPVVAQRGRPARCCPATKRDTRGPPSGRTPATTSSTAAGPDRRSTASPSSGSWATWAYHVRTDISASSRSRGSRRPHRAEHRGQRRYGQCDDPGEPLRLERGHPVRRDRTQSCRSAPPARRPRARCARRGASRISAPTGYCPSGARSVGA